jgi:hypothetical protein
MVALFLRVHGRVRLELVDELERLEADGARVVDVAAAHRR